MSHTDTSLTIAGIVAGSDDFNILLKAVTAAGLDDDLAAANADLTVFAPTDDAFRQLAKDFGFDGDPHDEDAVFDAIAGALAGLAPDGNPIPVLTNVLLYHVSPGAKPLAEVASLNNVPTLLPGATFSPDGTTLVDNEPDLPDPSLVQTDLQAANGIIHVIDRVLIPLDIPGNESNNLVIEAEDFQLSGYKVEHDGDASDDALIKLAENTGSATTVFEGPAGQYDLQIDYFDEIDGSAKIDVLVDGEPVKQIALDQNLGGIFATAENATSITIDGLDLETGSTIELVGHRNGNEFARIDKVTLTPIEPAEPTEPPTIAEVATENGNFGILLKALEAAWLTDRQIEAARIAITRFIKRSGRVWIRVFPDKPVTKKPQETRMGKGKGSPEFWVAVVKPGRILYEMEGVTEAEAKEALRLAGHKLPIRTKFTTRFEEAQP